MIFYLGTHLLSWTYSVDVPLFLSHRRIGGRKSPYREATTDWALDSGGFSELSSYGLWRTTEEEYVAAVRRYADEIGRLRWVAPQDWMCEPAIRTRTGLTTEAHQRLTIENFLRLRERLGDLVIPVVQGWEDGEHLRHAEAYERAGVDLSAELLVGVGSICRRRDARGVIRSLNGLRLHGFGLKGDTVVACSDVLASADSMAWSYRARRSPPLPGCSHRSCSNCREFALLWRRRLEERLSQLRLWEDPCLAA